MGQGYFVAGPGLGCTSPDIWRIMNSVRSWRLRNDFVVMSRISSAAGTDPRQKPAEMNSRLSG